MTMPRSLRIMSPWGFGSTTWPDFYFFGCSLSDRPAHPTEIATRFIRLSPQLALIPKLKHPRGFKASAPISSAIG